MLALDHITIAAQTLEQGLAYVKDTLGVDMPYGGEHPRMGTHNHLLRLGEALFLELIAINPAAPPPGRPRWFQLDDPAFQQSLARKPSLITWVVRTDDIAARVSESALPLGSITPMSRGKLHWHICVPDDGSMPSGGMFPTVIQWPKDVHPVQSMPELGYRLDGLEICHQDPAGFVQQLQSIGADKCVRVLPLESGRPAYLQARIHTPTGIRLID